MTASTINEVIQLIYTADTYTQAVINIISNSPFSMEHLDDVKNDLMMYMMEQPQKVVNLFNKGELIYFFVAVAKQQIRSTKSKLYGRYINRQRKESEYQDWMSESQTDDLNQFDFETDEHQQYLIQKMLEIINNNINTNPELKRNLTLLKMNYFEGKSYRQIEKETGIVICRISQYIQAARSFIKNEMGQDLFDYYDTE